MSDHKPTDITGRHLCPCCTLADKRIQEARHRTETATKRAAEAHNSAAKRNETIRMLGAKLDEARRKLRQALGHVAGYQGNDKVIRGWLLEAREDVSKFQALASDRANCILALEAEIRLLRAGKL
jgi:hypothetical protein